MMLAQPREEEEEEEKKRLKKSKNKKKHKKEKEEEEEEENEAAAGLIQSDTVKGTTYIQEYEDEDEEDETEDNPVALLAAQYAREFLIARGEDDFSLGTKSLTSFPSSRSPPQRNLSFSCYT